LDDDWSKEAENMLTVYGIKNCDTVRKALAWLDDQGLAYTFCDVRTDGLETSQVRRWVDALGWESVLNRRSTTWRNLSDMEKSSLNDITAVGLVVDHPTVLKRPLFEGEGFILQGFTDEVRTRLGALTM
jgi:arsenate reductase